MYRVVATALFLIAATPAAAAPPKDDGRAALTIAGNPMVDKMVAARLAAVTHALLDVRIDGVLRAADPVHGADPGAPRTLRDVVTRDDPDAERHMVDRTDHMVATVGRAARATDKLIPQIEALRDTFVEALNDDPR
jgi:hypothetical protein